MLSSPVKVKVAAECSKRCAINAEDVPRLTKKTKPACRPVLRLLRHIQTGGHGRVYEAAYDDKRIAVKIAPPRNVETQREVAMVRGYTALPPPPPSLLLFIFNVCACRSVSCKTIRM